MGSRGAVASGQALASQVGISVLQAGGNAVDAAVAVGAALNMVEPNMSGIGGDGFIMVYMKGASIEIANGTGAAPLVSNAETFRKSGIPRKGILSVAVPGVCDAWLMAHEKHGRLPLERVLAPAIQLAEDGFPVSAKLAASLAEQDPAFAAIPFSREVFCKDDRPLRAGEICRNPNLARTFRLLVREGRDAFYGGEIARMLVEFSERTDGLLTMQDFKRHRSFWQEPISTTYRDFKVFEAPPNSSGLTLLQELNLIEHFDLGKLGCNTADAIHVMVEAKRLAFADREAFVGDPDFVDVPTDDLVSKEYAASRVGLINRATMARGVEPGMPSHSRSGTAIAEDTTCFVIADGEGNAVCQLQSLQSSWGSGLVAGETGILLNNRMTYWHLEEDHPDCLQPGKRVRHTMNSVMVFTPTDQLAFVLGTPGADTQVQTNLQMISHLLDFGLDPQEAVESPRWRHIGAKTESEHPHADADELRLEARFEPEVIEGLRRKGHVVTVIGGWEAVGSEMIIKVHPDSGALCAGADPRRDGYALAW